jgi:hypothetical protein
MKHFQLEGIVRQSKLKQTIFVNADTRESAIEMAKTFADDVVYVKESSLGKDWENEKFGRMGS